MGVIKYHSDINACCLKDNFKRKGWIWDKHNWNIFWGFSGKCKSFVHSENGSRLRKDQLINHFPNSYMISRKDSMPVTVGLYVKEMEKMGENIPEIIPKTFILPRQYGLFLREYDNCGGQAIWIMKPCCKSQGIGIFLTQKLEAIRKYGKLREEYTCGKIDNQGYVICRYLDKPLLIGGRKFDLRMYVLVTSFQPLKAYLFKDGFCRFSIHKYDLEDNCLHDRYMHLTNHSIQKRNPRYNKIHGEKWSIQNLRLYLEGTLGLSTTNTLFNDINIVIIHSLKAAQLVISSNLHCFECFGYDVIIDENLKPWLIEINSSPQIGANTEKDRILKQKLISSVFSIVLPPDGKPDISWNKIPKNEALDYFDRLIDEDMHPWCEEKCNRDQIRKDHLLFTKGHNCSNFHFNTFDNALSKIKLHKQAQKENVLKMNRSCETVKKGKPCRPKRHSINGPVNLSSLQNSCNDFLQNEILFTDKELHFESDFKGKKINDDQVDCVSNMEEEKILNTFQNEKLHNLNNIHTNGVDKFQLNITPILSKNNNLKSNHPSEIEYNEEVKSCEISEFEKNFIKDMKSNEMRFKIIAERVYKLCHYKKRLRNDKSINNSSKRSYCVNNTKIMDNSSTSSRNTPNSTDYVIDTKMLNLKSELYIGNITNNCKQKSFLEENVEKNNTKLLHKIQNGSSQDLKRIYNNCLEGKFKPNVTSITPNKDNTILSVIQEIVPGNETVKSSATSDSEKYLIKQIEDQEGRFKMIAERVHKLSNYKNQLHNAMSDKNIHNSFLDEYFGRFSEISKRKSYETKIMHIENKSLDDMLKSLHTIKVVQHENLERINENDSIETINGPCTADFGCNYNLNNELLNDINDRLIDGDWKYVIDCNESESSNTSIVNDELIHSNDLLTEDFIKDRDVRFFCKRSWKTLTNSDEITENIPEPNIANDDKAQLSNSTTLKCNYNHPEFINEPEYEYKCNLIKKVSNEFPTAKINLKAFQRKKGNTINKIVIANLKLSTYQMKILDTLKKFTDLSNFTMSNIRTILYTYGGNSAKKMLNDLPRINRSINYRPASNIETRQRENRQRKRNHSMQNINASQNVWSIPKKVENVENNIETPLPTSSNLLRDLKKQHSINSFQTFSENIKKSLKNKKIAVKSAGLGREPSDKLALNKEQFTNLLIDSDNIKDTIKTTDLASSYFNAKSTNHNSNSKLNTNCVGLYKQPSKKIFSHSYFAKSFPRRYIEPELSYFALKNTSTKKLTFEQIPKAPFHRIAATRSNSCNKRQVQVFQNSLLKKTHSSSIIKKRQCSNNKLRVNSRMSVYNSDGVIISSTSEAELRILPSERDVILQTCEKDTKIEKQVNKKRENYNSKVISLRNSNEIKNDSRVKDNLIKNVSQYNSTQMTTGCNANKDIDFKHVNANSSVTNESRNNRQLGRNLGTVTKKLKRRIGLIALINKKEMIKASPEQIISKSFNKKIKSNKKTPYLISIKENDKQAENISPKISFKENEKQAASISIKISIKENEKQAANISPRISIKENDKQAANISPKISIKENDKQAADISPKISIKGNDKLAANISKKTSKQSSDRTSNRSSESGFPIKCINCLNSNKSIDIRNSIRRRRGNFKEKGGERFQSYSEYKMVTLKTLRETNLLRNNLNVNKETEKSTENDKSNYRNKGVLVKKMMSAQKNINDDLTINNDKLPLISQKINHNEVRLTQSNIKLVDKEDIPLKNKSYSRNDLKEIINIWNEYSNTNEILGKTKCSFEVFNIRTLENSTEKMLRAINKRNNKIPERNPYDEPYIFSRTSLTEIVENGWNPYDESYILKRANREKDKNLVDHGNSSNNKCSNIKTDLEMFICENWKKSHYKSHHRNEMNLLLTVLNKLRRNKRRIRRKFKVLICKNSFSRSKKVHQNSNNFKGSISRKVCLKNKATLKKEHIKKYLALYNSGFLVEPIVKIRQG